MKKFNKIVFTILILITILIFLFGLYNLKTNTSKVKNLKENHVNSEKLKEEYKDIKNILLIGVDETYLDKGSRSDTMVILTIDNKHNNLKLTSLARDLYVNIEGYDEEKLTHAYAYEGPNLLLDTIRKNLGIKIDDYISINFSSFVEIINIIGGIEVNIEENDLKILNETIPECYKYYNKENKENIVFVKESGLQMLNGYQSLAFSRIRKQDSAYERDKRQREVIIACIKSIKETGIDKYTKILKVGLENTKTNIDPKELVSLGYRIFNLNYEEVRTLEFPIYKEEVKDKNKGWIIKWDKESNLKDLNSFIFQNEDI